MTKIKFARVSACGGIMAYKKSLIPPTKEIQNLNGLEGLYLLVYSYGISLPALRDTRFIFGVVSTPQPVGNVNTYRAK